MIETFSSNTNTAEFAIILALIALLLSGFTVYWTKKQLFNMIACICKIRDDTEDAIVLLRNLMDKADNENNS